MPKSNKIKRQEKGKKEKLRRDRERKLSNSFAARKEKEEKRIQDAINLLAASKVGTRNPKETLKALSEGEKVYIPSSSPLYTYASMFKDSENEKITNKEKEVLYRLLCHCIDQNVHFVDANRLQQNGRNFVNAIKGLVCFHEFWVRSLEDWKPMSYNTRKQFSSLARHLFTKYHVPLFMDDAFYTGNSTQQDWFIHIGSGENIRTAPHLPIPLTRKAAHHMMTAPNNFDINAAIRWGQILAMGGDERMIRAILKTRIGVIFVNNDFWESVFKWLMDNPMLDTAQYAPLMDYIYNQKFVPSIPNQEANGPRLVVAQPNFSMKKRSVDATIKAMEEWHKQTGRARNNEGKAWGPCGILEFFYEEGETNKKIYIITELLTAADLQEEGRAMYHCVGSYGYSCSSGRTSVWSMKQIQNDGSHTRMLTVEVDNQTKTIRQARGKYNCKPDHRSTDIMNRWARASGLSVSRWLI